MTDDRPARLSAGECFDEALPLGAARPTPEPAPARPTPSEQKAYEQGLDDGRLIEQAARRAAPADLPSVELAEALWAEQFPDAGPLSEQGPIATRIWTAKAERVMVYLRASSRGAP